MNKKLLWTISLFVICCITIIWTVCNFAGVNLPDTAVRIMGILDLCAIPILIYSSINRKQ
ncbi:MAG: hypothetical protein IJ899_21760 [Blautia sp.]|nr:hypothetical protein [Blautia sp.]